MKGLLIKDLCTLKTQKNFFIMLIFMAVLLCFTNTDTTFIITYTIFILTILSVSTLSYDTLDNGMSFLLTLPITRKQYVKSKYILGIIMMLISGIVCIPISYFFAIVKNTPVDIQVTLLTFAVSVGTVIIFLSITFPVQFKFGAEVGRVAMFIISGAIIALAYFGMKLLHLFGISEQDFSNIDFNSPIFIVITVLTIIACYLISYMISTRILQKKQY